MTSIRTGARALGLQVQWRFAFVAPGSVLQPAPDAVYLDTGSHLKPGILDQHQDSTLGGSSAELVWSYPAYVYDHLMLDWLRRARDDAAAVHGVAWAPALVTHWAPDFDGLVAIHLCMRLVEDGEFPPYAKALVEYASLVDQGRYRVDLERPESATHAIHMAYLALQSMPPPAGRDRNQWCLEQGLALLEAALGQVEAARRAASQRPAASAQDLLPGAPGADAWRQEPSFVPTAEILEADRRVFSEDREGALDERMELPAADGGRQLTGVPALVLRRPSRSKLNKYWARAEGFAYFVCPYERAGDTKREPVGGQDRFARVILSLDPTWTDPATGRRPTLAGLGYQLEKAETRWRRDNEGGDHRGRVPRWTDGSCDNADPWYDGRGHDHTIVDSPSSGTFLPYEQIESIATSPFWKVPVQRLSLTLIEPFDPPGALGQQEPKAVAPFPNMAATLLPFVGACGEQDLPAAQQAGAPPGCRVLSQRLRSFPNGTAPPVVVQAFERAPDEEAYLEDLMAWVQARRAARGGRLYVCASLVVGHHSSVPRYLESLLQDLGGGELKDSRSLSTTGEVVLFNSRAIIGRPAGPLSGPRTSSAYLELLLYAVFLHETLTSFSSRIASVIGARHQGSHAAALAEQFLRFQTRYYQQEVATHPWLRTLYGHIADGLLIRDHYAEVQSELDRLSGAADRESASKMEWLLFAITLVGIISTVLGFPADAAAWTKLLTSPLPWSALAAVVVLTVLFWRVKRGPKVAVASAGAESGVGEATRERPAGKG